MLNRDIFSRAIVRVKFPDDPFLTLEILDKLGSDIEGTVGDMEYFEISRRNLSKYKSLIDGNCKKMLLSNGECDFSWNDVISYDVTYGSFYFENGKAYATLNNKEVQTEIQGLETKLIPLHILEWFRKEEFVRILKRGYFGESIKEMNYDVLRVIAKEYDTDFYYNPENLIKENI